jgi:hypothetical protein
MMKKWAGAVCAVVAMLVAPGGALAADSQGTVDGISYLTASGAATIDAPAVLEIPCPGTKRPMGGGYQLGLDPTDTLRSAAPADLNGDGKIDGWRVIAETGQPTTAVGTEAGAMCRKGTVKYVTKLGSLPATPGALTLTAKCPTDMHITGGGARRRLASDVLRHHATGHQGDCDLCSDEAVVPRA